MTGFGRGVVRRDGERATVELRSVNHRYLDVKLRGAVSPSLEDQISGKVRAALERGAVTVAIQARCRSHLTASHIDETAARAGHAALVELAAALGLPGPDLALVLAQPGVIVAHDDAADTDAADADDEDRRAAVIAPLILDAVDIAIAELRHARFVEGASLQRELTTRLDELERCRHSIGALAGDLAQTLHRRLVERVAKLAGDIPIDPGRLAQEAAVLADRADIEEELVRLDSHFVQARQALASASATGRKLEFLSQELAREFNTIGAKSQSSQISAAVIEAKTALEKFREQVQNVE